MKNLFFPSPPLFRGKISRGGGRCCRIFSYRARLPFAFSRPHHPAIHVVSEFSDITMIITRNNNNNHDNSIACNSSRAHSEVPDWFFGQSLAPRRSVRTSASTKILVLNFLIFLKKKMRWSVKRCVVMMSNY